MQSSQSKPSLSADSSLPTASAQHTVEKIGGTSMSRYEAVRDNIVLRGDQPYQRVLVVSAYAGVTNLLLDHKKTGEPGVFALFANTEEDDEGWREGLQRVQAHMEAINAELFEDDLMHRRSQAFVRERLGDAERCLSDLRSLCRHGHFALDAYLQTVREMLASLGEAHSAWNMTQLLGRQGINARFIDLTGWDADEHRGLDEVILRAFSDVDLSRELPIVTGYAHCGGGLMATFDRGYSEITFSRIAVLTGAREAIIHKEYHLSSADPGLVGAERVVPIGRTNYDVADQLANLGMEAIHPQAAKGLRKSGIPLRVKNSFEPEHAGTLVTSDYVSQTPCVEIIAGRKNIYAIECFDPDMTGALGALDASLLKELTRCKAQVVGKDVNANTVTHYLGGSLKAAERVRNALADALPEAAFRLRKVAMVSAIGSDLSMPGLLAQAVSALARAKVEVIAMQQAMRQVDLQFIVAETDYDRAVTALHQALVEVQDHGSAICAA